MPFSAGDKLGPYEIVALIGKGGMGEVYRAHDPRLGRDVAIKVSAERFSARFEREARAVAALNHPNICTLYDVGPNYLVMEYVEGENLKGPLALDEALRIARQIVDALEAAHEKRITHRDLKPANIKIKPDGLVKVLDFGLAKMHEPPGEDGDTVPLGMTEDGAILGTPSYMSPEQALGKKADKRSDIWAFGVVLYEMLTGQRLFKGKEMGDILESVVKDQPNLDAVPAKVKPLLERCLEKDPRKRLRDIGDVELLLADAPVARPARPLTRIVPWVIAAVLAVVAGAASWTAWHATPLSRPLMRLNVDLGPDVLVDAGFTATISPDGTRLVFLAGGRDGVRRIAVRPLDRTQATLLQGTENAGNPFFSPDSQWIGFSAQDKLQKISVQGGAAVTLCDSAGGATASWGEDGNIIASLGGTGGLFRIPDTGGTPQPVTKLENGEVTHRWPQVLPGAKAVLFTSSNSAVQFTNGRIEAMSFKTGEKKILVRGGYFGRYLPSNGSTGHLVYLQHGVLFAVPFDPVRLEIRGSAVAVLEDVAGVESVGAGHFGFSQTGAFVYALAGSGDSWSVLWLDSSGKTEPLLAKPGIYYNPRFSPDGLRLAMTVEGGKGNDIYVYDWKRDIMSRLTFTSQVDGYPTWTPDGKHLVFSSQDSGAYSIQWIRADGAGEAQPLLQGRNPVRPFSFSPDGRRLAYQTIADIWTLPLDLRDSEHPKAGTPEPFLRTPAVEIEPALSPDGRWMAYTSGTVGNQEVFVRPFPGPGGKWQISSAGGKTPMWSRNGRELFFEAPTQQIMAVDYTDTADSFVPGKPRLWSEKKIFQPVGGFNLDLAPDGKRFAVFPTSVGRGEAPQHVTFLLNFFDELRRRAPEGKFSEFQIR